MKCGGVNDFRSSRYRRPPRRRTPRFGLVDGYFERPAHSRPTGRHDDRLSHFAPGAQRVGTAPPSGPDVGRIRGAWRMGYRAQTVDEGTSHLRGAGCGSFKPTGSSDRGREESSAGGRFAPTTMTNNN